MPLAKGPSPDVISGNIKELVKAGHPQNQAVAIAERVAKDEMNDYEIEDCLKPQLKAAMDTALAFDRSITIRDRLAFDRSKRRMDEDGRLYVSISNISKANVCGYMGNEIPDPDGTLNLEPGRTYMLLRSPEELEKAAPSFNGIPIIDYHIRVGADDPKQELIIGSTGTDAEFVSPYLRNSLSFWTAEAIEGIESDTKRELSCGYYYKAVMTPGVYEGVPYDGLMTNIRANHVVTCEAGRAGPDVIVGDSVPTIPLSKEIIDMSKTTKPSMAAVMARGALMVSVLPKLATDHKLDARKLVNGVTAKNWEQRLPGILALVKPKMASDSALPEIMAAFDAVSEEVKKMEAEDEDEDPDMKPEGAMDEDDEEEKAKKAKEAKAAMDAEEDDDKKEKEAMKEKKEEKAAMDAAIKSQVSMAADAIRKQVMAEARDTREAESFARSYVGEIAIACDSADQVYKAALDILKVDVTGVPSVAYKHILAAQQKPGERKHAIAQDSAVVATDRASFAARFPNSRAAH